MPDVIDESDCTSNSSVDLELFCEVVEEDSLDYRESFPSTVAPYQFEPYLEDADDKNNGETGVGFAEGAVGLEVGDGEQRLETAAWYVFFQLYFPSNKYCLTLKTNTILLVTVA